jgi:hypothetical protein
VQDFAPKENVSRFVVELWRESPISRRSRAASGGKAAAMDRPLHLALASSAILSRVVGERWLAVSDTESACDPLLSQGIMKALHDGVAAARDRHMHGRAAKPLLGYQEDVFARFR